MQVQVPSNPDVVQHDQSTAPGKERERDPILGGEISNITNGITASNGEVPSHSRGYLAGTSTPQDNAPVKNNDDDPDSLQDDPQVLHNLAVTYLASQTHPLIIPSYASWFSFSTIHPLERRSLPEFFSGKNRSKTPAIYKDYRDFMMNTYRLNPSEYLTVTACRRNLAGDVGAIMRVHAFLEQWGLINYQLIICTAGCQVDPETRPAPLGPPTTGHFRVSLDTPKGLQPLHPGTRPATNLPKPGTTTTTGQASSKPATHPSNLDLRKTIYSGTNTTTTTGRPLTPAEATKQITENAAELRARSAPTPKRSYACDTCGTDCSRVRYHSLKDGNYTLCVACYTSGRFPSTMHSGGFVRMDEEAFKHALGTANGAGGATGVAEWADQETLLLLEGIEMYDSDWDKVAQHVGTRSKEQCVMHFLQLPIEDEYLDEPDAQLGPLQYSTRVGSGAAGAGGAMEGLPFAQADNPVMSVVAFLASAVGPGVAAAAAQSALGELTNGLRSKVVAGSSKEKEEKAMVVEEQEKEGQGKKTDEEAMDVDLPSTAQLDGDVTQAVDTTSSELATAAATSSTLPRNQIERAAALALGAAAAKASTLATHEERHIQSLVTRLIQAQTRKLESKITMFEKFEELLEQEKRNVELAKQAAFKDRMMLVQQLRQVQGLLKQAREQNVGVPNPEVMKAAQEMEASLASTSAGATVEVPTAGNGAQPVEVPDPATSTYATLA
ncbi:hypothetical protein QFC22_003875 [Naganishia vaughanmartiniae]|uniref:Uncharacterized protein n=1 Tax=Naganishia vaughanmartiniae TaxID=1424756 RepID=A0ACC2X4Y2_9TREE|nr:hypothetical protein QFC22_003875 [Naganishia vaughanmartiniae]